MGVLLGTNERPLASARGLPLSWWMENQAALGRVCCEAQAVKARFSVRNCARSMWYLFPFPTGVMGESVERRNRRNSLGSVSSRSATSAVVSGCAMS